MRSAIFLSSIVPNESEQRPLEQNIPEILVKLNGLLVTVAIDGLSESDIDS
jgi:hypothetical protein